MKIKFDEQMKKTVITYVTTGLIMVLLFFCFYNFSSLQSFFSNIFSLIMPFILGFSIAFLLNQPMIYIHDKLLGKTRLKASHKRSLAAILAMILGIIAVSLFFWLLIPQLAQSVFNLIESFPMYIDEFEIFINEQIASYNLDPHILENMLGGEDVLDKITNMVTTALPEMMRASYNVMSTLLNIVLGVVSALYMMMDKRKLLRGVKIINYAVFPKETAEYLHRMILNANEIFNNFIIGKAIDSLIIGILCYIGMSILQLPYAVLLSVIVGITNMIPVFGPFIGAVPGMFILLIIHPIYSVYFALFILALQQFDGNILGPLILGDKLGLSSIWILFSVCVGGGLFGIIGMFIGVPLFTVIYSAIREVLTHRLEKKSIPMSDFNLPPDE